AQERARCPAGVHPDRVESRGDDVVHVDDDRARVRGLGEHARMPRDLLRPMRKEILSRDARPDVLPAIARQTGLEQRSLGLGLAALDQLFLVDRVRYAAAKRAARRLIELGEQGGLARVPDFRIRAAHVGHGEHVEIVEVGLVADRTSELVDHVRVVQVLLLRRQRQQQMVLHEPGDEASVVAAHPVLEAERLGIDRAELRVVAAAALRDVVEQAREVGALGLLEPLHHGAALRELVVEAGQGGAAQSLGGEQCMRGVTKRARCSTTNSVCASTVYAWNRSYCIRPTTRPNAGMYNPRTPYVFIRFSVRVTPCGARRMSRNKRWWRGFWRNSSSMSHRCCFTSAIVRAFTPRRSRFCSSSRKISSSADGSRANTWSAAASREPLRLWKRGPSGNAGSSLSSRIASSNSCSSISLSRLISM